MAKATNKRPFSIITTCKGRLSNLMRSLPQFVKQDAEVIVVDYDCPDGTRHYVKNNFPSVIVVCVDNEHFFNLARARNFGARIASGDKLIFLDADIIVADIFLHHFSILPYERNYWIFKGKNDLRGSCIISRDDFLSIDGYDELLSGYDGEDLDIYMRLRNIGVKPKQLSSKYIVQVIEQNDDERLRFRPKNIKRQFLRGQLYQLAKEMTLRTNLNKNLDFEFRRKILQDIEPKIDALMEGTDEFNIELNFPDPYRRGLLKDFEFSYGISIKAVRKIR